MKLNYFSYAVTKQNLQLTILLRNNACHLRYERVPFALRTRSICVSNAFHLRYERAPFAFRTRFICVLNALHLRSERAPFAFQTRSVCVLNASQSVPVKTWERVLFRGEKSCSRIGRSRYRMKPELL